METATVFGALRAGWGVLLPLVLEGCAVSQLDAGPDELPGVGGIFYELWALP